LSSVSDDIRALRHTASEVEASATIGKPRRPWPLEAPPAQQGRRKLNSSQPVISTLVTPELRLKAHLAADLRGQTVSDLIREALAEKLEEPVTRPSDWAVQRLARSAAEDEGYRAVLLDLAREQGGIYAEAARAIYSVELRTLGRWEALARLVVDQRALMHTRAREGEEITLVGVTGDSA
jgi:hypothetical protein